MRFKVSSNGKRTLLAGSIFLACFSTIVLYLGATRVKTVFIYPIPPSTYGITEIGLKRSFCGYHDKAIDASGMNSPVCSESKIVIKSDCAFRYTGNQWDDKPGIYIGTVSDSDFRELCRFINDSQYMGLKNSYEIPVYHMPSTNTSVAMNGKRKGVSNYGNAAPPNVWALEELIDKLLSEAQWHKVSPVSTKAQKSH